ncbi:hypothetical protein [Ramlibacter alkalitolerans]|uniref:Uncharacterized protein n=1 Tax=Ramlibacter alkalitolerans TaxID=2039631 RepID=A0ABS1JMQ6_9BURK|nr:hypothetical protein [Ramlibacter alkalitolerans]MBL0425411.1 hypothetical protein [Ramlibacter alkalitolerans]
MSVWAIESIQELPEVTLRDWAVFEVPLYGPEQPWTRHLAGWSCEGGHGQVCSPVAAFDPVTATCMTQSGRVYRLLRAPGLCSDGQYVLNRWMRINRMPQMRDVTAEVFLAIQDAARARLQ